MFGDIERPKPLTNRCIVLDLDETLVHTQVDPDNSLFESQIFQDPKLYGYRERCYRITMEDVVHRKGTGNKSELWGITRPYLEDFLKFCFSYFRLVIVWSAGRKNYVHRIVDHIFRDLPRPDYIFTYDYLEKLPDNTFIKPLKKIWDLESAKNIMLPENSFIIDDRKTVFWEPNRNNGIQIPAYRPPFTLSGVQESDDELLKLKKWFQGIPKTGDVRSLNKVHIFK